MRRVVTHCVVISAAFLAFILAASRSSADGGTPPVKTHGVFCTASMLDKARANAARFPWAADVQKQIVANAAPWMNLSDEELWNLMFGPTITRSWMVWSNGYCPACKHGVPMYTWEMDALGRPWKVRCPHCKELFPKNDFHEFHLSGLDEQDVFDPKRADRSLLFNTEHPDPKDPLHMFGVDDGEGYVEGANRWRFIGAYLIYGQWKQAIVGGIHDLAAAYVVTRDPAYAHKAGVLLDRVADLYPTFDFGKQGTVYEVPAARGYVSTWHDACVETRDLVLSYDQVFEALRNDAELVAFLSRQAQRYHLDSTKASFADIQRNIEDHILRDAIANRPKLESNYPQTDITIAMIETVLGWPANREQVYAKLDAILDKATAVDGVTGEKGLAGYAAYAVSGTALLLEQYARMDPDFLRRMSARHPRLHDTFRFHIDTWCMEKYYPSCGDSGAFAHPTTSYAGVSFSKSPGLTPSMFTFMWRLYQLTGDVAFVQVPFKANGGASDGLPYDLFADDPAALQKQVQEIIARAGPALKLRSVNKQEWHLAILRSGRSADERALWLDYDSGGAHSHADGMNLGLFAKGLDLLPDFGYPPVNYGGWGAPRAVWYTRSAAHNTVVVDGENTRSAAGKTTLWADGKLFRAIRASCPELIEGKQYERTAVVVDISPRDFYVVDIFRVIGGTDHARFTYSHFGQIAARGLSLKPAADYRHDTQTRSFAADPAPAPGWSVDWKIEDRRHLLPAGADMHLRLTDLTTGAQAWTGEAWVAGAGYDSNEDTYVPLVMARRQSQQAPLASTFVSVLEPYEKTSNVAAIRRLPLQTPQGLAFPDPNVALEVALADGRRDLLVLADAENPLGLTPSRAAHNILEQKDWGLRLDGEAAWVRRGPSGAVEQVAICKGTSLTIGDVTITLTAETDYVELAFRNARAAVVAGSPDLVADIVVKGRSIWRR